MAEPDANPRLGHAIDTSVGGETVRAFVPPPLPPHPPIDTLALLDRLSLAERALGRLDEITLLNPQTTRFSPLRSGPASPSWPALSRPSAHGRSGADGRVKAGHDGKGSRLAVRQPLGGLV